MLYGRFAKSASVLGACATLLWACQMTSRPVAEINRLVGAAAHSFRSGQYLQAESQALRVLALDPSEPRGLYYLALSQACRGNLEQAQETVSGAEVQLAAEPPMSTGAGDTPTSDVDAPVAELRKLHAQLTGAAPPDPVALCPAGYSGPTPSVDEVPKDNQRKSQTPEPAASSANGDGMRYAIVFSSVQKEENIGEFLNNPQIKERMREVLEVVGRYGKEKSQGFAKATLKNNKVNKFHYLILDTTLTYDQCLKIVNIDVCRKYAPNNDKCWCMQNNLIDNFHEVKID